MSVSCVLPYQFPILFNVYNVVCRVNNIQVKFFIYSKLRESCLPRATIFLLRPFLISAISIHCAYLVCCGLIATMLLTRFTLLAAVLETGASAVALSTIFSAPTSTLTPRDTPTDSTSAIEFMTVDYITIPGVTNDHVTLAPQTISIAIPTCIQTITPDKNGYVPPVTCNALYNYYPSFVAALVFSCFFWTLTVGHIWQAAYFKTVLPLFTLERECDLNFYIEILLGDHHS